MRCRATAAILAAVEENYANGISFYFFTDDNFSRSPIRDELLDGLADLRARGVDVSFMMQVDTCAHRIPGFAEKAARAGCYMVFVGMESVNPANLDAMGKTQNDAGDYPMMVNHWHDVKVLVHVGYIIGLPHDTTRSVQADVEALMNQVKVDEASFFMLTPLPGSRDHQEMVRDGVPMDADLNNFDSLHETFRHPRMAPGEWIAAFGKAWETFYSKEEYGEYHAAHVPGTLLAHAVDTDVVPIVHLGPSTSDVHRPVPSQRPKRAAGPFFSGKGVSATRGGARKRWRARCAYSSPCSSNSRKSGC